MPKKIEEFPEYLGSKQPEGTNKKIDDRRGTMTKGQWARELVQIELEKKKYQNSGDLP